MLYYPTNMRREKKNYKDFSVIIPTFNRSRFLRLAIISALRQKDVAIEVIVGDDGSTDDTEKVVKAFHDKRIKYFRSNERMGTSINFQKCFLRSSGNYIFTLGDDDFILEDSTLAEVWKVMRKYKLGMGKIGGISYQKSPRKPHQTAILSDKLMLLKPKKNKTILTESISFDLGFFSGLVFNNSLLDRNKLKINHVCYLDHMCQMYHRASYDLIQKAGIAYIPNHFIIARLSLQMIPRYFNINKHGRFFIEEPILLAREFINDIEYEGFKKRYLRDKIVLLPNIKIFSDMQNYIKSLQYMISIDKTLLRSPGFLVYALIGLMPKFIVKALRSFMLFYFSLRIRKQVSRYKYFEKLDKLGFV